MRVSGLGATELSAEISGMQDGAGAGESERTGREERRPVLQVELRRFTGGKSDPRNTDRAV